MECLTRAFRRALNSLGRTNQRFTSFKLSRGFREILSEAAPAGSLSQIWGISKIRSVAVSGTVDARGRTLKLIDRSQLRYRPRDVIDARRKWTTETLLRLPRSE